MTQKLYKSQRTQKLAKRKIYSPLGVFRTKEEKNRYKYLKTLEQKEIIRDLDRGIVFRLPDLTCQNKKGETVSKKAEFKADIVYVDKDGITHMEMLKRRYTGSSIYAKKKKLMSELYDDFVIEEI